MGITGECGINRVSNRGRWGTQPARATLPTLMVPVAAVMPGSFSFFGSASLASTVRLGFVPLASSGWGGRGGAVVMDRSGDSLGATATLDPEWKKSSCTSGGGGGTVE